MNIKIWKFFQSEEQAC